MNAEVLPTAIDSRRYRRVRRFFFGVLVHVLWWDVVLRLPGLRWLRTPPLPRWRRLARRYRRLAVELGGVLIKLGQYLSTRVDVLPAELLQELAGLRDEVPSEPYEAIAARVAEDFGRPVEEVFAAFERQSLGSASLAQVHAARLPDGREVVVKVLRPRIEVLVETDLAAVGLALSWIRHWKVVSRRADLDWLLEEFATTTRRELDMHQEAANATRFAECFADDPRVLVPRVFPDFTTRHVLTEENVAGLKIDDREGLAAAGIDPREVAKVLFEITMLQIFEHDFVHADPHAGNLFLHPGEGEGQPFRIAYVDFGMMTTVPERLRGSLRELIIGLATRDAGQMIRAFASAGLFLPGADLEQLEEVLTTVLERLHGVKMGRMNEVALQMAPQLLREFGQLALSTPVQLPMDMLFTGRALELLGGLATSLDPEFDPWSASVPFAERLATGEVREHWRDWLTAALSQGQVLARLPWDLAQVTADARRGRLTLRTALAPDARQRLRRLEGRLGRLNTTVGSSALLLAGAFLYASGPRPTLGGVLLALGALGILWGWLRGD